MNRAPHSRSHRRTPQLGGVVSVTPIRNRLGDEGEAYSISWHSPGGDLRWLSPRIHSQDIADVAAQVLTEFVGGVKR